MKPLQTIIQRLIDLRDSGRAQITLLAVCPNSAAVLEAAVKAASRNNCPMLFAATLNQVDTDGGYTGWTAQEFVNQVDGYAQHHHWDGPLYPCLDHGGPWLKDLHTLNRLTLQESMSRVKESLSACIAAGYKLLHIDPTVDRSLPAGTPVPLEKVVERTVELMAHAESARRSLGTPEIAYEVGTEEVHGGLVEFERFERFLAQLKASLDAKGLGHTWPRFIVAQVGTDLHTTSFDPEAARRLYATLAPLGSLAKGHYTDWVENPGAYPASGMGGANVGPEFTAAEYLALKDLCQKEQGFLRNNPGVIPSRFLATLQEAVIASKRWMKWLQPDEIGLDFNALSPARQDWLLQTGSRYIWTAPQVVATRQRLYDNVSAELPDPHAYVVDQIEAAIDRYIASFGLFDSLSLL